MPQVPDGPLVTSEWLEAHHQHPRVRILDVRGRHPSSSLPHAKRTEYARSHLPGATFVDWEHDFVNAGDPVPVQLADPGAFAARAGALGIDADDLVVTYDDYYGIFAARVAWAFRAYGVQARVLDGGWTTWNDEGRPVTPAALARLSRDAGIDPERPPRELIATCGSGVSATVALLALERIGIHCDGVYDGSFNEW